MFADGRGLATLGEPLLNHLLYWGPLIRKVLHGSDASSAVVDRTREKPILTFHEKGYIFLMGKFEIRLMFEWGGACLWGMNAAAKEKYGYSEIERVLPLPPEVSDKLAELSKLHDEALDWADPAGPSPWAKSDFKNFESEALSLLQELQDELGDQFHVWYVPLGAV